MILSRKPKKILTLIIVFSLSISVNASYIFIPMDENQQNHLKAYGIAYYAIERDIKVDWLLNYQGGSFLIKQKLDIEKECKLRNVSYNIIADIQSTIILQSISSPEVNQDVVRLERAPKIAIYSPKNKQPWDDAVTMALSYAEIPYEVIYDTEVLNNLLPIYDWLHLHHEDFTGQYGKFYSSFKNATWYKENKKESEKLAKELGYNKVSKSKLA
ncbi:MAG: asparagine synthetase B, partial [Flavobacteriales bacterium]|nr:asparagine synthetase B [Flavobacteriales bacterium]